MLAISRFLLAEDISPDEQNSYLCITAFRRQFLCSFVIAHQAPTVLFKTVQLPTSGWNKANC